MGTPKFLGVFSRAQILQKQVRTRKRLYFVWEVDKAAYAIQELNEAMVPKSPPTLITPAKLQTGFRYEPGILAAPISLPDLRHLQKGEVSKPKEAAELTDATLQELEKARQARQVENDLRSSFAKALRALSRPRDRKGALAALETLAEARKGIVPVHKHMFRDFGVSLRKKSLPELALRCCRRVVELAPNDDHAHFNLARILGILGFYDEASAHLKTAMKLDGKEPVYGRLLSHLQDQAAGGGPSSK